MSDFALALFGLHTAIVHHFVHQLIQAQTCARFAGIALRTCDLDQAADQIGESRDLLLSRVTAARDQARCA